MSTGLPHARAIGHPGRCGWFWAWAAVGFGLVLSFGGIFSIGPFLIPFVTLLLGAAAARRASIAAMTAGLLVATAVLLGGPPACLLLVAAGLAAFPLMRPPAETQPLPR